MPTHIRRALRPGPACWLLLAIAMCGCGSSTNEPATAASSGALGDAEPSTLESSTTSTDDASMSGEREATTQTQGDASTSGAPDATAQSHDASVTTDASTTAS